MNVDEFEAQAGGAIRLDGSDNDPVARTDIIEFLQHLPNLMGSLKSFAPSDSFRVIISAENAHLFRQAAAGTYKPFLRDGGKFVENVSLKKLPPDTLGAVSNLLMTANMAAIAADLSAIKIDVRDLGKLLSDTTRGGVSGAINSVEQARASADATERRRETLGACRDLSAQLGVLTGQLKAHAAAMPEAETRIFHGFFGSGLDEVDAKWREVEADLVLLKDGLRTVLSTYSRLNEPASARVALSGFIKGLKSVNLTKAAQKARLVPLRKQNPPREQNMAPEEVILMFARAVENLDRRLFASPDAPQILPITADFKSEEVLPC